MTDVDNAYFFGFIGVASALVFASISFFMQTSGLPMGAPKQELEYVQWEYWSPSWSWSQWCQWLWQVFWVYMVWSWLSSSTKRVVLCLFSPQNRIYILWWICTLGFWVELWIQLFGCRTCDRNSWRCWSES